MLKAMKKEGKIAQTFTEDGLVKIRLRKGKGEPTHTIRNRITLETIVAEYTQTLPSSSFAPTQHETSHNSNTNEVSSIHAESNSNNNGLQANTLTIGSNNNVNANGTTEQNT